MVLENMSVRALQGNMACPLFCPRSGCAPAMKKHGRNHKKEGPGTIYAMEEIRPKLLNGESTNVSSMSVSGHG